MAEDIKMVKVVSKCNKCGVEDEFYVPRSGLDARGKGKKIREAFPGLDESRIRQLTEHICPGCQGA